MDLRAGRRNWLSAILSLALSASLGARATPAKAADCERTELEAKGGSMEHVPPYNQTDSRFCYAAVATQYYDAFRFMHGDTDYTTLSSPLEAALGTALDPDQKAFEITKHLDADDKDGRGARRDIDAGYANDVLLHLKRAGSCPLRRVNETPSGELYSQYLADFEHYRDEYNRFRSARARVTCPQDPHAYDPALLAIVCDAERYLDSVVATRDLLPSVPDLCSAMDDAYQRDNPLVFLQSMVASACTATHRVRRDEVPVTHREELFKQSRAAKIRLLEDRLATPRSLPVAVGYCINVLFNPDARGLDPSSPTGLKPDQKGPDGCRRHASLIVGKRMQGGHCQFEIRQTRGPECNDKYGAHVDCQHGDVWVDAELLSDNLYALLAEPGAATPRR